MSRLWILGGLLTLATLASAQQPPDDPRSKESYRLELRYAEDTWKFCRANLADLWERGNTLERDNKRLQDENQRLKDELARSQGANGGKAPDAPTAQ